MVSQAEAERHPSAEQAPGQEVNGKLPFNNKPIRVCIFLLTLLLGIAYLGLAVIFTLVVYLMPLASEDLYSYLFSGIQFMIVVVSTQYAYNLFAGKTFSCKKVLKHAKEIIYKNIYGKRTQNVDIVEQSVDFFTVELLIPCTREEE